MACIPIIPHDYDCQPAPKCWFPGTLQGVISGMHRGPIGEPTTFFVGAQQVTVNDVHLPEWVEDGATIELEFDKSVTIRLVG